MTNTGPVNLVEHGAKILGALEVVEGVIAKGEIPAGLRHLVKLRASQINKCAFCVEMHTREARRDGETNGRLDHLIVWRHVNDFTAPEKAAFAWTEALTELNEELDLGALRAELRAHYSDSEISTLTGVIAMINLWNRIGISNH